MNQREENKMKFLKSFPSIMKLSTIVIIILSIVVFGLAKREKTKINELANLNSAQAKVSLSYDEVTDNTVESLDESTGEVNGICEFVEFSSFFTQDLNEDGIAERVNGACTSIEESAQLYFRFAVLSKGYLENAKIEINGENFKLDTAIPKDNVIPRTYIESDTREIQLAERVQNGTQKNIISKITPRITTINDYSRNDNTVIFTGTFCYTDENNNEIRIPVRKVCNLTVDWYGELNTEIISKEALNFSNENIVNDDGDSIDLEFSVKTRENKNYYNKGLILDSNVVAIRIPDLKGYSATNAVCNDENVEYTFDKNTKTLTITRKSEINENGEVVKKLANTNEYSVVITYPAEVYDDNMKESLVITVPIETYYTGYNNPNSAFENEIAYNIAKSNVARANIALTYEKPEDDVFELKTVIGEYVTSPTKRYVVSKKETIKAYSGDESEEPDLYEVKWSFHRGDDGVVKKTIMDYTKSEDLDEDSFDDYTTNIGIYFDGALATLGLNGTINVYDADKSGEDALIHTFTKDDWSEYTKDNPYLYENGIKDIRVEISESNKNSSFIVHKIKEIDNETLANRYTQNEFKEKDILYTYLTGKVYDETENLTTLTRTGVAYYEDEKSIAKISVYTNKIATTETKENEIIRVTTESGFNKSKWKDGEFVVELPEGIKSLKLNNVTSSKVSISAYTSEVVNGKYIIRILTQNDELVDNVDISIDCDITPDSTMPTTIDRVNLYAYNANYNNYDFPVDDTYDVNNNGKTIDENDNSKNDKVGFASCELQIVAPSGLITYQTATNYDDSEEDEITIAPNVAEVKKSQRIATINVDVLNNYSSTVTNTRILGKIPYENNTYVITNGDLGSTFTTVLQDKITLTTAMNNKQSFDNQKMNDLRSHINIYYSAQETPTNDISDASNGWIAEDNVTDYSEMKSYLIDLGDFEINKDDDIGFSYNVAIPQEGVEYEDVSYSQHAVYFDLNTVDGKLADYTEPNKLGIRITRKFDLTINKTILGRETLVPNAVYLLETGVKGNDNYESHIVLTDENGQINISGLYVGRVYSLSEMKTEDDYEVASGILEFIVRENSETKELEVSINNEGAGYKTHSINNDKMIINVEDRVRYDLDVVKYRKGTNVKIPGITYMISTGTIGDDNYQAYKKVTDADGKISLDNLYLDTEYTIEEFKTTDIFAPSEGSFKFIIRQNAQTGDLSIEEVSQGAGYRDTQFDNTNYNVTVNVEDEVRYSLSLNKKDENGSNIPGVTYKISGSDKEETGLTDENGYVEFNKLSVGTTYTITEIAALGYYLNNPIEVVVSNDGNGHLTSNVGQVYDNNNIVVLTLNETDKKIPNYNLELIKVEKGNNSKLISGASFRIKGKDLDIIETTDENGKISLSKLYQYVDEHPEVDGIYEIQEQIPAQGYILSSDVLKIRVSKVNDKLETTIISGEGLIASDENGKIINSDSDKVTMTLQNMPVFKVKKVDAGNNEVVIPNTKFAIYKVEYDDEGRISSTSFAKDVNGNTIGEQQTINGNEYYVVSTNDDGELTADLPEGLYYLYEVEAADGYILPDEDNGRKHYFGIGESKNEKIEFSLLADRVIDNNSSSLVSEINYVVQLNDGYVISGCVSEETVIGQIDGSDVTVQGNFIAKYDKDFNELLWYKETGMNSGSGNLINKNNNDDIIMFGTFNNSRDSFVIKYSASGNELFRIQLDRDFVSNGAEFVKSENGFEILETYSSDWDEYEGTRTVTSIDQGTIAVRDGEFILKYNDNGELVHYYSETDSDYALEKSKFEKLSRENNGLVDIRYIINNETITTQTQGAVEIAAGNIAIILKNNEGNNIWVRALPITRGQIDAATSTEDRVVVVGNIYEDTTIEIDGREWPITAGEVIITMNLNGNIETIYSGFDPLVPNKLICDNEKNYIAVGQVWGQAKGRIQKYGLDILNPEFAQLQEITVENNKKQYKITTEVKAGEGTISGEGQEPYEVVNHGGNSTLEIKADPEDGWIIKRITVNGVDISFTADDNGNYVLPQFEQMDEDKHIVVWFGSKTPEYNYELTKTDENGNPLAGAKFIVERKVNNNATSTYEDAVDKYGAKVGFIDTIDGEEEYVVISDENGKIKLDLPYGEYRIKEVEAPYGYRLPVNNNYTNFSIYITEIDYIEDLIELNDELTSSNTFSGKTVVLNSDLDFNNPNSYRNANDTSYGDYNGDGVVQGIKYELTNTNGSGFSGIGEASEFRGTFNGNGHEIKNIYMKGGTIGLFAQTYNATIKNIKLTSIKVNCTVTGIERIGGIVGYARNTNIINCYASGTIDVNSNYSIDIGGIVGLCNGGKIESCTSDVNINANISENSSVDGIGGIAGICSVKVDKCNNNGNITINNTYTGSYNCHIGGIVGYRNSSTAITNSYNTGNIESTGDKNLVGAMVGRLYGDVENCYNTGRINGFIIDGTRYSGSIKNYYNVGQILQRSSTSSSYSKVYYLTGSATFSTSTGTTRMSETDMKSQNFVDTLNSNLTGSNYVRWTYNENDYPSLNVGYDVNNVDTQQAEACYVSDTKSNEVYKYRITTEIAVNSENRRTGGTISGTYNSKYCSSSDYKLSELVEQGGNNTVPIVMTPAENYGIVSVNINGKEILYEEADDGSYTIPANYFTNMNEDAHIIVKYEKTNQLLTINKVDSVDNTKTLKDAKIRVQQIEDRDEPTDDLIGDIVANGIKKQTIKYDENDKVDTADIFTLNRNSNQYYFQEIDGKYIPNNTDVQNSWAGSYVTIDLTGKTGNYLLKVSCNGLIGSESNTDIGPMYGWITNEVVDGTSTGNVENNFINKRTVGSSEYTQMLSGGNIYYLNLRTPQAAPGNYQYIEALDLYSIDPVVELGELTNQYCYFKEENGKLIPTNNGINGTVARSYVEIDLSQKTGNYKVVVDYDVTGGELLGDITTSTDPLTSRSSNAFMANYSGYSNGITKLTGGRKYYLHLVYAGSTSGEAIINSINVYPETTQGTEESIAIGELRSNTAAHLYKENGIYKMSHDNPGAQADSYVEIDLTDKTDDYCIVVKASGTTTAPFTAKITDSSENSGISANTTPTKGVFLEKYNNSWNWYNGIKNESEYIYHLSAGKKYYLHFNYYEIPNATIQIDSIKFYKDNTVKVNSAIGNSETEIQGEITESNGKYSVTHFINSSFGNDGAYPAAFAYKKLDLTGKDGEYILDVNFENIDNSNYTNVVISESEEIPDLTDDTNIIINLPQNDNVNKLRNVKQIIQGGKVYYIHFVGVKRSPTGSGQTVISSVNAYKMDETQYYFEEIDGKYVSNNQNVHGSTAQSYIPIDLTNCTGKYNLNVSGTISSESGDKLILRRKASLNSTSSSDTFAIYSGEEEFTTSTVLTGGRVWYLVVAYEKNSVTSSGTDTATIDKVELSLNTDDFYSGEFVTNEIGQIKQVVPFGKYQITEIEAPEGYALDDTPIEFVVEDGKDNTVTIKNKLIAKVKVHHYLKLPDGTETEIKVADDEEVIGGVGDEYTTSPKTGLEDVELERDEQDEYVLPSNATGEYTSEVQEVTYYYEAKDIQLIINHYYDGTEVRINGIDEEIISYPPTVTVNDDTYTISVQESYTLNTNNNYNNLLNDYVFTSATNNINDEITINDTLEFDRNAVINYYYNEKGHKITTEVIPHIETREDPISKEKEDVLVKGGSITGEYNDLYKENKGIQYVETVKQNKNGNVSIVATPDNGYVVKTIKLVSTDDNNTVTETILYGDGAVDNAEVSVTKGNDEKVTLSTFENVIADKHITVEFAANKGKIIVHHYYEGTGEEYNKEPVYVKDSNGDVISDDQREDYIGEKYATKAYDDIAEYYQYVGSSGQTNGTYIDGTLHIYYYYKYNEYDYTVNYLEKGTDNVLHTPKTVPNQTFGDEITSVNEKITIDGYNYDSVDPETLVIGAVSENNVINVYYTKRNDLSYTVNYLEKGTNNVLHNPKTEPNQTFGDEITSVNEKITIDGYNYDSVDPETLVIGAVSENNVINVYYTKRNDLSYTVNYLEKGTNNVLHTPKTEPNQTFGDEITSVNEKITIDGYNYDSVDPETLVIGAVSENNVINVYYTKRNDLSYTVNYLEKGTDNVLHTPKTEPNQTFGDEITSVNEKITIDGYNYDSVDPEILTIGASSENNVINVYYTKRNDLSYTVNYLEKGTDNVLHTPKTEPNQTFGDVITSVDEKITIDGYYYDSVDPETLTIGVNSVDNVINIYYTKRDDMIYTVHYYYDGIEDEDETDTFNATYKSVITTFEDKANGYTFEKVEPTDANGDLALEITSNPDDNRINVFYRTEHNVTTKVISHTETDKDGTTRTVKGGTISGDGLSSYEKVFKGEDTTKTIVITPDNGYEIVSVKVNGDDIDYENLLKADGSLTLNKENGFFEDVDSDKHVEVEFRKKTNVIVKYLEKNTNTVLATEDTISGYENKEFETSRKSVSYYKAVDITDENDNAISTYDRITSDDVLSATGTMYADTLTIIYWYERIPSGIIVKHIAINEADKQDLDLEDGTLLDEETIPGYVSLTENTTRNTYDNYIAVDGPASSGNVIVVAGDDNSKTVTYREDNVVEVRYYYERQYKVTTESGENGTISGEDDDVYELINDRGNNSKEIVITPDAGYRVKEVKINGTVYPLSDLDEDETTHVITLGAGETNAFFKDVQEDKHVSVEFERIPAKVIVKYKDTATGEEVVGTPEKVVEGYVGDNYDESAIEIPGYILAEDTVEHPLPTNSSGPMTEADIEVVYWYTKQFTITTSAGEGGTSVIEGNVDKEVVTRGENNTLKITITPDDGYNLDKILINDVELDYENDSNIVIGDGYVEIPANYFTNVQENIYVVAEFARIPATVKVEYLDEETNESLYVDEAVMLFRYMRRVAP